MALIDLLSLPVEELQKIMKNLQILINLIQLLIATLKDTALEVMKEFPIMIDAIYGQTRILFGEMISKSKNEIMEILQLIEKQSLTVIDHARDVLPYVEGVVISVVKAAEKGAVTVIDHAQRTYFDAVDYTFRKIYCLLLIIVFLSICLMIVNAIIKKVFNHGEANNGLSTANGKKLVNGHNSGCDTIPDANENIPLSHFM